MSSIDDDDDIFDTRPTRLKDEAKASKLLATRDSTSTYADNTGDRQHGYGAQQRPKKRQRQAQKPYDETQEIWTDSDETDLVGTSAEGRGNIGKNRKKQMTARRRQKVSTADGSTSLRRKEAGDSTGVGRHAFRKQRRTANRQYNDTKQPSDEEGIDHTLPTYIQERRDRFADRYERMKEAGLSLPPTYDDIDFSDIDDESMKVLEERPHFRHLVPPAKYEDIELPYSLGVIPAPVAQYLRDYQVQGAAFLHELFVYQKGGILGDDMGLGKTIQVIAFLTAMYGKTGDQRDQVRMRKMQKKGLPYYKTLIICPGAVMANWQEELTTWGWWHIEKYHGSQKDRDDALAQAREGWLEIMITTYTTYRIYQDEINTVQWDCVIADECHIVKERKSGTTAAMNQVNALCRIGLTGTAIQNKYEELWTLLNWTNPGTFGPISQWQSTIAEPLKVGQSHNATGYELKRARQTADKLVKNLLPQFFLRRMKTLIKDQLPKKTDKVIFCPLTPIQQQAYQNFLESDYVQYVRRSSELCDCESSMAKRGWCCYTHLDNGDKWQAWVFPCIIYLQKASNHLALLIPSAKDSPEKQSKDTDLLETSMPDQWKSLVATRDSIINYSNPEFCGKWKVLKKLLQFWHDEGSNKVLVFSHSVRLLKMLQQLFIHTDYNVTYLDGSLDLDERYTRVKDFNSDNDAFVFLISTRAGGVGLNITSANKVVVVDPNWNPSHDLQAQDRAYRIGQQRDVEVYRLVSQGTMEEVVYARQIYKQQQSNIALAGTAERRYFDGVQDDKGRKGELFGLQNLFANHGESAILRDIVHKTNVAETRAGFNIVEASIQDDSGDDEADDGEQESDGATHDEGEKDNLLSQIAAKITSDATHKSSKQNAASSSFKKAMGDSKKKDPVQAILASAGVGYLHENSEVIGTSRVEVALSKRAAANSYSQNDTRVFTSDKQSQEPRRGQISLDCDGGEVRYRYRPSAEVKRRQFGAMAKWAGFTDVVEFAFMVESSTQAQRRDLLEKWYHHRRDVVIRGQDDTDALVSNRGERAGPRVDATTNVWDTSARVKSEYTDNLPDASVGDAGSKGNVITKFGQGPIILDSDDDEL